MGEFKPRESVSRAFSTATVLCYVSPSGPCWKVCQPPWDALEHTAERNCQNPGWLNLPLRGLETPLKGSCPETVFWGFISHCHGRYNWASGSLIKVAWAEDETANTWGHHHHSIQCSPTQAGPPVPSPGSAHKPTEEAECRGELAQPQLIG